MAHQTVDLKEREAFLAAWMIGTKLLHRRLEKSFKKTIHYFEHTRAGWVYEDLLLWDAIINKIMEFFFFYVDIPSLAPFVHCILMESSPWRGGKERRDTEHPEENISDVRWKTRISNSIWIREHVATMDGGKHFHHFTLPFLQSL